MEKEPKKHPMDTVLEWPSISKKELAMLLGQALTGDVRVGNIPILLWFTPTPAGMDESEDKLVEIRRPIRVRLKDVLHYVKRFTAAGIPVVGIGVSSGKANAKTLNGALHGAGKEDDDSHVFAARSVPELVEKLKEQGAPPDVIKKVVEELKQALSGGPGAREDDEPRGIAGSDPDEKVH